MRGNPDGSLSSTVRLKPQGLLALRYVDGLIRRISTGDEWEANKNKVAAGVNPAAIATLVGAKTIRGNTDGSLSSIVRLAPQGLLSLRYIEGSLLRTSAGDDWEAGRIRGAALVTV